MDERRVLLIGRRAAVLTRLAGALRAEGIEADQVQDPAGVRARAGYRVVAFGRAVKPADRERIRREFAEADPEAVFVDGYAPITELLVAQFEQALDRRPLGRRAVVDASVRGGIVDLELRSPCRLRITAYRLDALYRTRTRELFDRQVEPGTHSAALDARSAKARNVFVVIRADGETVALAAG
ncbi:hypothetical protein [Actinospica robiniae]|uniref:hypothetical protein n=1 Tax=Actinospica robiniae TaxID=304901 RepID=UPI0012F87A37|nr:hypothetical protein [Actinospica robiniae]